MTVAEGVSIGLGFLAIVAPDFWPKMPRPLSYTIAGIGLCWLTYSGILEIQELSGMKPQIGPMAMLIVGAALIAGGIFWHISQLKPHSAEGKTEIETPENLNSLSNAQMRTQVQRYTTALRVFATGAGQEFGKIERKYPGASKQPDPDKDQQDKRNAEHAQLMNKIAEEYEIKWRPTAVALQDTISRKLGRFPPYQMERDSIAIQTRTGNPMMMFWAADYLEALVRQLP